MQSSTDTFFTGTAGVIDAFGWDLENAPTPTDDATPGSFSENTVMRFMYDLWDPASDVAPDVLSIGLGPIADAFAAGHRSTSAFATLGSFVTSLKARVTLCCARCTRTWPASPVRGTGGRITVTGSSTEDVAVSACRQGVEVGFADNELSGPETFSFNSISNTVYIINLTGYGTVNGNYNATMDITSP